MSEQRLDSTLLVDRDAGVIYCGRCDERLCDTDENYKRHALCERTPIQEAGPLFNDPEEYVDEEFEFRRYYCPGCATQLETEVILADSDPIHDKELTPDDT